MRRLRASALLLGALALVLSACSGGTSGYTVKVGDATVSNASFTSELQALRDNKLFGQYLQQQGATLTSSNGTISQNIAATWLTIRTQQLVVDQLVSARHVKVTAQDQQIADQSAAQIFGDPSVFAAFPRWFQRTVGDRQANYIALANTLTPAPTDAQARAYYAANASQLCPSGKVVSHILVQTQQEANDIESQLRSGADFASLAKSKSIDTGSASLGGDLGCLGAQQFVPSFDTAANTLSIGQVSAPVQSQYGWHVIKVTAASYDSLQPQVLQALQQNAQAKVQQAVLARIGARHIKVNPRYGTWGATQNGTGVVPPQAPTPAERPPTSTTSPAPGLGGLVPGGASP